MKVTMKEAKDIIDNGLKIPVSQDKKKKVVKYARIPVTVVESLRAKGGLRIQIVARSGKKHILRTLRINEEDLVL